MQEKNRVPNAQRSATMRTKLLDAARTLFVAQGYAETGTPQIVKQAGVTRGALYHHFEDKRALFHAIVEAEAKAVTQDINTAAHDVPGMDALQAGTEAFFDAMRKPGRAQLLLIDGPSVLGWRVMAEIDAGAGQASLRDGLRGARPDLQDADIEAMATVLSAAFDRAALAVAEGEDPEPYKAALLRVMGAATG